MTRGALTSAGASLVAPAKVGRVPRDERRLPASCIHAMAGRSVEVAFNGPRRPVEEHKVVTSVEHGGRVLSGD